MTRFLTDENLAGLARWLRFLGFDAETVRGLRDEDVAARGRAEGRVVLTRDRDLADRAVRLRSDDLRAQLREVLGRFGAPASGCWFTRCTACNAVLRTLDPGDARVPPSVRARAWPVWECPCCRRAYWPGSHYDRTRRFLEEVTASASSPTNPALPSLS